MLGKTRDQVIELFESKIGAGETQAALRLLEKVESSDVPETHLYKALCQFRTWDFDLSIPLLETYLRMDLASDARLTGLVHLAKAQVNAGYLSEALATIAILTEPADGPSHAQQAVAMELRAQVKIAQSDFDGALSDLAIAERVNAGNTGSGYGIRNVFIRKWRSIATALKNSSIEPLIQARSEATEWGHAESLRDLDLAHLRIQYDEDTFHHLWFGTPFRGYRMKIERELGRAPTKDHYVLGHESGPVFDLSTGEIEGAGGLDAGGKLHQVLNELLMDFYKPVSVSALFHAMFPGETYEPEASGARVRQLIYRVRLWIQQNELPVELLGGHGYSLRITGPIGFKVPLERTPVDWTEIQLRKLVSEFGSNRLFSSREARAASGLPSGPFKRFANECVRLGRIERIGTGKGTRYRLIK